MELLKFADIMEVLGMFWLRHSPHLIILLPLLSIFQQELQKSFLFLRHLQIPLLLLGTPQEEQLLFLQLEQDIIMILLGQISQMQV